MEVSTTRREGNTLRLGRYTAAFIKITNIVKCMKYDVQQIVYTVVSYKTNVTRSNDKQ